MSNLHPAPSTAPRTGLRLATALAGAALALQLGTGIAAADPIVDTTCSYPQVVAAMNDQAPEAAAKFNTSPMAQAWLQRFLASPPAQRAQMAQQAQAMQGASKYMGLVNQVMGSCNNY